MRVSDLSHGEYLRVLRREGISLRIGPFIIRLQSSLSSVAQGVELLYADYPLESKDCFADFHIRLTLPENLRRWFHPQVLFFFDGRTPFKPLPRGQAFPMFEWGLNWCVHSHANQYLVIHAAVVERDGYAVIMPAPPGSGKSTLCAALVNRGWRLLSDELALISVNDGMITPMPRPVSLKNESIDVIRRFSPEVIIGHKAMDTTKGIVAHMKAPFQSVARSDETAKPAWLIFPRYQVDTPAIVEPQSKGRAFMRTARDSFNYSRLGLRGFQVLADLIDFCDCFEFTYSNLDEAMDVFASLEPPSNR